MEIIRLIIFGFVIGVIARFLMPGPQPMGIILTTVLGVAGSFVGGYLGHLLHGGEDGCWQPAGWIGSIIGAALLLLAYGLLAKEESEPCERSAVRFQLVAEQVRWRSLVGNVRFQIALTLLLVVGISLRLQAAETFPVKMRIDAEESLGPLRPIWRFFGADEPNYATMPNGRSCSANWAS